jgi:hypothetical protein
MRSGFPCGGWNMSDDANKQLYLTPPITTKGLSACPTQLAILDAHECLCQSQSVGAGTKFVHVGGGCRRGVSPAGGTFEKERDRHLQDLRQVLQPAGRGDRGGSPDQSQRMKTAKVMKNTRASDCSRSKGRLSRMELPGADVTGGSCAYAVPDHWVSTWQGMPIRLSTGMSEIGCGCGEKLRRPAALKSDCCNRRP